MEFPEVFKIVISAGVGIMLYILKGIKDELRDIREDMKNIVVNYVSKEDCLNTRIQCREDMHRELDTKCHDQDV